MPCPATPQSEDPRELGFKRRRMVSWHHPWELIRTGVKILLSSMFGSYADKREIVALQEEGETHDYSASEELWIDYIADLGDGFDSTYTMASLMAPECLQPADAEKSLERGRILIFGGDQVYPIATRELYNDRLVGPYQAALPWVDVDKDEDAPHLFAIPGNHDWYDGLTSFNRLFTKGRWIGGHLIRQTRSYFALKLPNGWWLWGVDVQLESDIDQPQLQYFKSIAQQPDFAGSQVILCTAEPSWVYATQDDKKAFGNLAHLEKIVVEQQGTVKLSLAGDLHHYARYSAGNGHHKITAGGGGAFYHETHNLPETLDLSGASTQADSLEAASYSKGLIFPEKRDSQRLMLRNLLFQIKNLGFSIFLGAFYLLFAWVVESASLKEHWETEEVARFLEQTGGQAFTMENYEEVLELWETSERISYLERIWDQPPSIEGFRGAYDLFRMVALHSPSSFILLLVVVFGLIAYLEPNKNHPKWKQRLLRGVLGSIHAGAHIIALIFVIWTVGYFNHVYRDFETVKNFWHAVHFILGMVILGGLVGGTIWGLYLLLVNLLFGCHTNAGSSAVKVKDYKNFLRLHLTAEKLEVFAVGVPRVNRRWKLDRSAKDGQPWFVPKKGNIADLAVLLETVTIGNRHQKPEPESTTPPD